MPAGSRLHLLCPLRQLFLQCFPHLLRADYEHAGMDLIVALVGSDDPGRPQHFEAAAVGADASANRFAPLVQQSKSGG